MGISEAIGGHYGEVAVHSGPREEDGLTLQPRQHFERLFYI
jgi:hypothetical protein